MARSFLLFTLIALATPAYAKKTYVVVKPGPEQISRFEAGVASVESIQSRSVVRLRLTESPVKSRFALQLAVANRSDAPFNVGTENVTVTFDRVNYLAAVTYEQLQKEEKRRQTWAAIAAGLSAMSNTMAATNAGRSYGTYSYGGNFAGTNYSGSGTVSTYNYGQAYAAQQLANLRNDQIFDNLAARNTAGMEKLKEILRTTTIDPGAISGGIIHIDVPKQYRKQLGTHTIKVNVNGDEHLIAFDMVAR